MGFDQATQKSFEHCSYWYNNANIWKVMSQHEWKRNIQIYVIVFTDISHEGFETQIYPTVR